MSAFEHFASVRRLHKLASHAVDLTQSDLFTPERIKQYAVKALGFTLLFGAERINEEVRKELLNLAVDARVMDKMAAMQSGKILNRIDGYESEQRAVLHTSMRDVFDHRQTASSAKNAAEAAEGELHKLERFLKATDGQFTDLIQIGIGGSDLGPRALCLALEAFHQPKRRVHFISNVDPDDANAILAKVDLHKTLVVVVSKSGSTLETLTNEEFVRIRMSALGIDLKKHFVAVTGEKSPMDDSSRYLACFYIWDFVGGRYSATSMVGAVMLGFALGFSQLKELLRGAHEMDRHALTAEPSCNIPLLSALFGIWNRNFLHIPTVAVIPYSQALHRFPAHLQQLDMESNGKRVEQSGNFVDFATGPVIWGEPGTNGQHSFYQLIHQGTDPIALEFIGFKKSQYASDINIEGTSSQEKLLANLIAQSIALATGQPNTNPNRFFPGNRPNRLLIADRLDPPTLGALLSLYEHKVAFQGFLWNINSFDQEGVQLGKKLATKVLSLLQSTRTKESIAYPLGEAYLTFF